MSIVDSILNMTTEPGDPDVTLCPSIPVASLAEIIRSKEAAAREKDRLALPPPSQAAGSSRPVVFFSVDYLNRNRRSRFHSGSAQ